MGLDPGTATFTIFVPLYVSFGKTALFKNLFMGLNYSGRSKVELTGKLSLRIVGCT